MISIFQIQTHFIGCTFFSITRFEGVPAYSGFGADFKPSLMYNLAPIKHFKL
ncbi:hypothetical protein LEP1GSC041_3119 [Leptospira noguchii str. 2006001870]|nr:hypothetical protein LEP1GSC041_3119 [Leptospira noguchii str. 2006001870]